MKSLLEDFEREMYRLRKVNKAMRVGLEHLTDVVVKLEIKVTALKQHVNPYKCPVCCGDIGLNCRVCSSTGLIWG